MNLFDLLAAGKIEEFNERRGQRTRLDFFAADLANGRLAGADLSGANLDKADLSAADLTDATLYKASLTGIDGSGMKLVRCMGTRARFKEAWLEDADLTEADLSRADLKEAVLVKSKGEGVRLMGARLIEVDAKGCQWPQADLAEAHLHKSNFGAADLRRADFTEAHANGIILEQSRLDGCIASRVRMQGANLAGASLMGARFDDANLSGADLTGADLTAADFSGANLSNVVLHGATLHGAVFANAILDGVDLSELDLDDVDLTGIDPRSVGLTDAQLEAVAAVGSAARSDAVLRFADVATARNGDTVIVFWENADTDEATSLRWCLIRPNAEALIGLLPTAPEGVLARFVVSSGAGFVIVLFQDRPGGVAVLSFPLSLDGTLGPSHSAPLGYSPAVLPIARDDGEQVWVWGMARRGPTLVVQQLTDEGLVPKHSEKIATARGFLGRHLPVVACKGGVALAVSVDGVSKPVRTPDRFPGKMAQAAPLGDRVCAVWLEPTVGEVPGGIRMCWLAARTTPDVEILTSSDAVTSLDVLSDGQRVWVSWIEMGRGAELIVQLCELPGGMIRTVPLGEIVPRFVRLIPGLLGTLDPVPTLAVTTAEAGLLVVDAGGTRLGTVGD